MAVKLCVIPGVCQCAVEELVQRVVDSANLLEEALSGKSLIISSFLEAICTCMLLFLISLPSSLCPLSLYLNSSSPSLSGRIPIDCSLLSPECIDAAAVQFRLLENLLTCDISTIISKDSKSIYMHVDNG